MNALVTELKTRARLRLNAIRRGAPGARPAADEPGDLKLRDCLNRVAAELGFAHFEHARRVLGGEAAPGEDMGRFWHAPRCDGLLNGWFASHAAARDALAADAETVLLPYRRQFVVVRAPYLGELGLDRDDPQWADAGRDLVQAYGSAAWLDLAVRRLRRAPPGSFG